MSHSHLRTLQGAMVESPRKQEDPRGHYVLMRKGQCIYFGRDADLEKASLKSDEKREWMQER